MSATRSAEERLYDRWEAAGPDKPPFSIWLRDNNKAGDPDFDPELLGPVEKIRNAEGEIRRAHRVVDEDWLFWGNLADLLNWAALIPEKYKPDWRTFNRIQDLANGYIRMIEAQDREQG